MANLLLNEGAYKEQQSMQHATALAGSGGLSEVHM